MDYIERYRRDRIIYGSRHFSHQTARPSITATSGSASATATVTVAQVAAAVSLSDSALTFASLADTTQLTATATDGNGETIPSPAITWTTSNDTVATVSSTGLVTAITNGTAVITATSGSASATASVTVAQVAATLSLSDSTLKFYSLPDTTQLTATVADANGEVIDGATVTWATSAASVVTVSSTGLVTSVGDGSATIIATSGSVSAIASVTVTSLFFLAPNGVTVICSSAGVGDTGHVGGVTYTKRSKAQITTGNAATTCSSDITDMSEMF